MLSPEVREDAQRFQELLSRDLIDCFLENKVYLPPRWPFSAEDHAVIATMSFAVALRLMIAVIRTYLPPARAEIEINSILAFAARPIES